MKFSNRKNNHKQSDESVYLQHTKKYTDLLDVFIKSSRSSNLLKFWLKIFFFFVIISIMLFLSYLFGYSIHYSFNIIEELDVTNQDSVGSIIGIVSAIISSLTTMIVSLIKLPKIIAKYLFNPEEDQNMVKIIGQIQHYDLEMYNLEKQANKLLGKQQGVDKSEFDKVLSDKLQYSNKSPRDEETNISKDAKQ